MQFIKTGQNLLMGLGLSLCLFSSAQALPESQYLTRNNLAEIPDYCQENESLFIVAETRGFWVNICGGDLPHTYIGVSKTNGNSIRLPLNDYDRVGNYFEAVNGDVTYLLIRGTPRGDFLTVTQGDKELFRQPILNWY